MRLIKTDVINILDKRWTYTIGGIGGVLGMGLLVAIIYCSVKRYLRYRVVRLISDESIEEFVMTSRGKSD